MMLRCQMPTSAMITGMLRSSGVLAKCSSTSRAPWRSCENRSGPIASISARPIADQVPEAEHTVLRDTEGLDADDVGRDRRKMAGHCRGAERLGDPRPRRVG